MNCVVHWRPNLFMILYGNMGRPFVSELVNLLHSFSNCSAMGSFALKTAMLMPQLLLQRPHCESSCVICSFFSNVLILA